MKHFDADKVLEKYINGTVSPTERAMLERWHLQWEPKTEHAPLEQLVRDQVRSRKLLEKYTLGKPPVKLWRRVVAAASVVIMLGVGFYFYLGYQKVQQQRMYVNDIGPGSNKAYLTLANGVKISLNDAGEGKLADQGGVLVRKIGEGQVVYDIRNSSDEKVVYNTITTPLGGQYQVNLPDGTRVWLNAGSSLKFPTTFATLKNRSVELTGEGYFEVYKDKQHPFIVNTDQQCVQVLGTHFNINSYADEPAVKTTVLEGRVKISANGINQVLNPGQQAINNGKSLAIQQIDPDNITDWKNNDFVFNGSDFKTAMRKIARWYNVEIVYGPSISDEIEIGGWISRNNNISSVLKLIESTKQVKFKIEGRRILVDK